MKKIRDLLVSTVRRTFNIDQKLRVGNSTIVLPPYHLLSRHQKSYKQYDRFLPHLSKYLQKESVVIDVGANVGDTVAAMVASNAELQYVCVEADSVFFDYLTRNADTLKRNDERISIDCYKCLVGLSVSGVKLQGIGGTKHAEQSEDAEALKSRPLDALVSEAGYAPVSLIKSDVDGYDYDVIDSAAKTIAENNCLLFFECYYDNQAQLAGYRKTLDRMEELGYSRFAIFDNFGGLVARSAAKAVVSDLMDYVRSQNEGESERTIYYFDVLAYTAGHDSLVSSALSDY